MKRYILFFCFLTFSFLSYSQTNQNIPERKINSRYRQFVDTTTIVILNNGIYTINDPTVENILMSDLDESKVSIQVINDEKSKTKIKHILIIHTKEKVGN